MKTADAPERQHGHSTGRGALLVGLGILLSRLAGLIRERVFAHYFGSSDAADVFKAALRIPNFLQNLFGEGVLSASFIPVYARLRAEGKTNEARDVAVLVGLALLGIITVLVLAGMYATPLLIDLIAPGFDGEKREFAVQLVRILFPGVGLLVLSAWCLGVLNTHGRFFLSYSAPVLWNAAIIVVLVLGGLRLQDYPLVLWAGYGVVLGSFLQTTAQLPSTWKLLAGIGLRLKDGVPGARKVLANFAPVVVGRGVVQISAYIDSILASLLPTGAVAGLAYAQTIYLLPVSLFGMSISAAELPAMSGLGALSENFHEKLSAQLNRGLQRLAFFVVPSATAFFVLGDLIADLLYKTGKFTGADSLYVWGILAGSTVGLLAATMGRLYASAFYAMHNTKTPLKFACIRVSLGLALGYLAALKLPGLIGIEAKWGVAGLTASSGVAGWVEFFLLRNSMNQIIGETGLPDGRLPRLWGAALAAAAVAFAAKMFFVEIGFLASAFLLALFGALYLILALLLSIPEAKAIAARASAAASRG